MATFGYSLTKFDIDMNFTKTTTLLGALLVGSAMVSSLKAQTIDLLKDNNLSAWEHTLADESVKAQDVFAINDGILHIKGQPFGFLSTKEVYENYKLHVEWMWPIKKSNSGVFVFVQKNGQPFPCTVECQLHAGDAGDFVVMGGADIKETNIAPGQERPKFIRIEKREPSNEYGVGEWNSMDIICSDGTITVYVNGTLQNIGTNSKYSSGHIALQSEGSDILFRNVRVTPLPVK